MAEDPTVAQGVPNTDAAGKGETDTITVRLADMIRGFEEVGAGLPKSNTAVVQRVIKLLQTWMEGTSEEVGERLALIFTAVEYVLAAHGSALPLLVRQINQIQEGVIAAVFLGRARRLGLSVDIDAEWPSSPVVPVVENVQCDIKDIPPIAPSKVN